MVIPVDPFIASSTAVLLTRLLSFVISEITEFVNVNHNLQLLEIRAQRIQEKLNRLEPSLIERWKPLVRELTTMYYDVDDIIDSVKVAEISRRRRSFIRRIFHHRGRILRQPNDEVSTDNITKKARLHMLSKLKRWGLPHKISNMLQNFRDFEEEINQTLEFSNNHHHQQQNNNNQVLPPGDAVPLTTGRQIDRTSIVDKLLQGGAGVSIVGMVGLGKSVLARSIVDDESVRNHFQIICWGSAVVGLENIRIFSLQNRELNVKGGLPIIRALLVLDEVVGEVLPTDLMGFEGFVSKIFKRQVSNIKLLITTRDPRVAYSTQTTPHYLKRMSDEDCKELIRMRMYKANDVLQSPGDRDFFNQNLAGIAKKSMGLPLLATVIAITLGTQCRMPQNNARNVISLFATRDLRELSTSKEAILGALRLGDPSRPSYLNKLLAYFTLFPRDHRFSKSTLLQLWMAEGFIQPERWTDWERAQRCFDDMLPSSMIEPVANHGECHNGPKTYQMLEIHGMFAQSIASNMCHQINTSDCHSFLPTYDTRHLSLCCQNDDQNISPEIFDEITNCKRLRTFLLLAGSDVPRSLYQTLLLLRVLDLSNSYITIVPHSIENLKHLRYLDFSYTPIRMLPESTCKLIGIRVIKLINCLHLTHLPKKIGNLINLIILDLAETSLSFAVPNIGKLTKLQILHKFTVMKEKGYQISELKHLNALRSLKITDLEKVTRAEEAASASLSEKSSLTSLELQWTENSMPESSVAEAILNKLHPTINLEELRVTNYSGRHYPRWLHCSASYHINLQYIHLNHWPLCTKLPPFWKLPVLRTLRLDSIHELRGVDRELFGNDQHEQRFVALEFLEFRNMTKLASWDGLVEGDMPNLLDLKFIYCPRLAVMSTLQPLNSLKNLEISYCDNLINDPQLPLSLESFYFS